MKLPDLTEHVEHFRHRVIADALQEATAAYWRRRAETFATAMPRPGDFTGRATARELEEQRTRMALAVAACRQKAALMIGGEIE